MAKKQKNAFDTYLHEQHETPQSEPIPGSAQVANSAGGYAFAVDKWAQLTRFLILGTEGGTYYASERALTKENAGIVQACLAEDGPRTVALIRDISTGGRAPKNTPSIFALAVAAADEQLDTRRAALAAMPQVCRTATHLFQFAGFVKQMRGWGRTLRRAVGQWYTERDNGALAYQLMKYRQRDGWTHTDALRLSHPKPQNEAQDALFKWVTSEALPEWATGEAAPDDDGMRKVWAFEQAKRTESVDDIVRLITDYDLVREAIPTQFLNEAVVWDALLQRMPTGAMLRNLGNMSKVGLLTPLSDAEKLVSDRLQDATRLHRARIHPIGVLSAMIVYGSGQGMRGSGTWIPTDGIRHALEVAFNLSFDAIKPTGKRHLLALDVSGSMNWNYIGGVQGLTPRVASAAMAMVTARAEERYHFTAFSHEMVPVKLKASMSLDDVVKHLSKIPMGGTDAALPMLYALEKKIPVDAFVVYTDSETWFGKIHPKQALDKYRQRMGIASKLIVVGMVANQFTIADPADAGMLDVVGFDTAAPNVMSDFVRGAF